METSDLKMTELQLQEEVNRVVDVLVEGTKDMTPIYSGMYVCKMVAFLPKKMARMIESEYLRRKGE